MANLPLAFAELLVGGLIVDAAIKGASITDVVTGKAQAHPIGGLSSSTPGGGSGTGSGTGTGKGGGAYVNPFSQAHNLIKKRIDQGQDFSMTPGDPILAPADMRITAIQPNWYSGQPEIVAQIIGGPEDGKFMYLAEQINPAVRVGQLVHAGDVLAHYANTGTAVEMGWAADASGTTLAKATTGYVEGQVTAAGTSFSKWLQGLGV